MIFSGFGWVSGRKNFPKILKLIVYYVRNLYQTVHFVNLQFGASLVLAFIMFL